MRSSSTIRSNLLRNLPVEMLEDRRLLATVTWDGGGGTPFWHDALNWSGDVVPTSSDDVIVDIPGDAVVEFNSTTGARSVNSLLITESFLFRGGTLNVASDSLINGPFQISSGDMTGSGNITLGDTTIFTGGKFSGSGNLIVTPGATLNAPNGGTLERVLDNQGTVNLGTGSLTIGPAFVSGTRIFNRAGAEFNITGDASLFPRGLNVLFRNEGTFNKSGAGTTEFPAGNFGGPISIGLENVGTLNLTAGELVLRGGGSSTTPIDVPAGATLTMASNFSYAFGTSLTGDGLIRFTSGTHDLTVGDFLPTGTVDFAGGTVTIGNSITPASFEDFRGIVRFNVDQTLDTITLRGTLGGTGDLTLTGTTTFASGTIDGSGTLFVPEGAVLDIPLGGALNRVLENEGTVNLGSSSLSVGPSFVSGTRIINRAGADFNITGDASFFPSGPNVVFRNEGTLTKSSSGITQFIAGTFGGVAVSMQLDNRGRFQVQDGRIIFRSTMLDVLGTIELGQTAVYDSTFPLVFNGGTLTGDGTVIGDVTNAGRVAPGSPLGKLTIAGDYVQTSLGTLEIELDGNQPGEFDVLDVTDNVQLDGTLEIAEVDGFVPAAGDVFEIIPLATITGEFESVVAVTTVSLEPRVLNDGASLQLLFDVNQPPVANTDSIVVLEDSGPSPPFNLLENDTDREDDPLTVLAVQSTGTFGNLISLGEGLVQYVPFPNAFGVDTLTYVISDGKNAAVNGVIQVEIQPQPDAPVANDDDQQTPIDTPLDILRSDLLSNDTDADFEALSIAEFTQPANGQLIEIDAETLQYVPNSGFVGEDQFTYTATDGLLSSDPAIVRVAVNEAGTASADQVRREFNSGVTQQREDFGDYAQPYDRSPGGLPLVPDDAEPFNPLFGVQQALENFAAQAISTAEQAVTSFAELQSQLEDAGFVVEKVAGDSQPGDDLLRVRLAPDPIELSVGFDLQSLADTPLAAIAEQASVAGQVQLDALLNIDFGFGVDVQGSFFVASDSSITLDLQAEADVAGDVGIFGLELLASLQVAPELELSPLDANQDGRLTSTEMAAGVGNLSLSIGPVTGSLQFDAVLSFLDYIDVDPSRPNRANGGDPFIVRGATTLFAQPSEFDETTLGGLDLQWSNVRTANPDIDGDGQLDYTAAAFLKNVASLGQNLLSGVGVVDYFGNVLGVESSPAPQTPEPLGASDFAQGTLPADLIALPEESAALQTMNEAANLLIVLEVGPPPPPTLEQLFAIEKEALRDWFIADETDDVSLPSGQSVQFRLAKIAPVAGQTIIPDQLVELISPIEDDALFDQRLIEAMSNLLRWQERVAVLGFQPHEIFDLPSDGPVPPLDAAQDAVAEGIREAISRAIARAESRTDAGGNTDLDALIADATAGLAWAAEAAIQGLGDQDGLSVGDVLAQLPLETVIESTELTGETGDATLTVRAGVRVKNPAGGFFPTIYDPRVVVHVLPGDDSEGGITPDGSFRLSDTSDPELGRSRGAVDATGRFATSVAIGPTDTEISLTVRASLGGFLLPDQVEVRKAGAMSLDLRGFLPSVDAERLTLRDGPITVPIGHTVQLVATVRRGNGLARGRDVSFVLAGPGSLVNESDVTDRDAEAVTFYVPPEEGSGVVTVLGAYFENGQLHQDQIEIFYGPAAELQEVLNQLTPSDFARLAPSTREEAFIDIVQALQAANDLGEEFTDEQRDGVTPFLRAWFEEVVLVKLAAASTDDALTAATRELLGWQTNLQLTGLTPEQVVPPGNPGGTLEQADNLLIDAIRAAIARDRARLITDEGSLVSTATSLEPFYAALQHSLDLDLLGYDATANGLDFAQIQNDFGIEGVITSATVTGKAASATVTVNAELRIQGQVPSFAVPLRLSVTPRGFNTVANGSRTVDTTGSFTTSASIGPGESELRVDVSVSIFGIDLASQALTLAGEVRLELTAFAGESASQATPGPVSIGTQESAGILIDAFRGQALLRNADLQVSLAGDGSLDKTSINTGGIGTAMVVYTPPASSEAGSAAITVTFDDGVNPPTTETITVNYAPGAADSVSPSAATESTESEASGATPLLAIEVLAESEINLSLLAALESRGRAELGSSPFVAVNGERVRLLAKLTRGDLEFGQQILYLAKVGEGTLSTSSIRTRPNLVDEAGTAEFFFTPPADSVGTTRIVVAFQGASRPLVATFDVQYSSTVADPSLPTVFTEEELAARQEIAIAVAQATLAQLQGEEPPNLSVASTSALGTWYDSGVKPRLESIQGNDSELEPVLEEYLRWAVDVGVSGTTDSLEDQTTEALTLAQNALRFAIESQRDQAIAINDGDAAVKALRLPADIPLITIDDPTHGVGASVELMEFKLSIDQAKLIPDPSDPRSFKVEVSASVLLSGVEVPVSAGIPVELKLIGANTKNTVGQRTGELIDGQFTTTATLGPGEEILEIQVIVGGRGWAKARNVRRPAGLVLDTRVQRTTDGGTLGTSDPIALGTGQLATIAFQLDQGTSGKADYLIQHQLSGAGSLSEVASTTDAQGVASIAFNPPAEGAGTSVLRSFILADGGVVSREITFEWDNALEPIIDPPDDVPPESSGLFNGSLFGDLFAGLNLPGTTTEVFDALGLESTALGASLMDLCKIVDGGRSVENWHDSNFELLRLIDFQSLVSLFTDGLPDDPAELVRVGFDLNGLSSAGSEALIRADFADILPQGMTANVTVDQPQLSGRLVLGLDTSSSPFYLLTQPDELSLATTPIGIDFGLNGSFTSEVPLIGTVDEPVLTIKSGTLQVASTLNIDLTHVATDPALNGKLRLDNLSELSRTRIGFEGDPLESFQAIVEAELRIPGVKESSTSSPDEPDAKIPLIGSISKPGDGMPFAFELRSGSLPPLSPEIATLLQLYDPETDDAFEENDSPLDVASLPTTTESAPTANLGLLSEVVTISELSLWDPDWFRFTTDEIGSSRDFVRVDFDAERGDVDLVLHRVSAGELTEVSRAVGLTRDLAQVSLLGLPAGEYFVEVRDSVGERNPSYALTIAPPRAEDDVFDLGLGVVDLQQLSVAAQFDTVGNFTAAISGQVVTPTLTLPSGAPVVAGFDATLDNDRFQGQATIDLSSETITLGDSPVLLEIEGLTGSLSVDIPFDGEPLTGGFFLEADTATIAPGATINATITGDPAADGGPIPGLQGSIDLATGQIELNLHRIQADLGELLQIDTTAPSPTSAGFQLTFNPDAAPTDELVRFASLTASVPALAGSAGAPSATVTDFGFLHDATPFLDGEISITIPDGFVKTLGIAEILPFEITNLALANPSFEGGFDADLRAVGTFSPISVPETDSFRPFVLIGDLPVDAAGDVTVDRVIEFLNSPPADVTKLEPGVTPFEFGIVIRDSEIIPFDIPMVTVGFEQLDLGVVEAAGFLGLGAYANRDAVQSGEPAFTANFAAGIDVVSRIEGLVGSAGVTLTGDFLDPNTPSDLNATGVVQLDFESPIPGLILEVDDARFRFDLGISVDDAFRFTFDRLDLIDASAERLTAGFGDVTEPLLLFEAAPTVEQPRAITLDFSREPGTHLISFGALTASLPSAPDPFGDVSGTIRNFAIDVVTVQRNGQAVPSLGFVPLDGFGVEFRDLPSLSELGLPDILEISELSLLAGDGFLDNTNLADFRLLVSAALELPIPIGTGPEAPTFRAAVEDLTIDVGRLTDGDLLNALDFTSVEVEFGTAENPISFGALSLFGGLFLENFDPTPEDESDRKSLIVRFGGGAQFAGMGLEGQLLFTEFGPIAAALSVSVGETGLPLGPVTIFEAGALVLFNEEPKPLPANPLDLIEPSQGESFSLAPLFDGDSLTAIMDQNARDFIVENRQREVPIATWESPFLFAIDATLGASGVPRSVFEATVTIGANLSLDSDAPEIILFGLGQAKLGTGTGPAQDVGTVGAVLELSDPENPTFQFAFATPSPGSELSDQIPANVRLGATFVKQDNRVQLDVFGEVNVLDLLEAEAAGTLVLDATGMFGQIEIAVGLNGGSGESTSLDLTQIGVDVDLQGEFELLFNLTETARSIERPDINEPSGTTQIDIPAQTTRLYVSGSLLAGGFEVSGAFLLQNDPAGLLVSARGELLLGDFGRVAAEGGVWLVSQQVADNGDVIREGGSAGSLAILADLGIPGLIEVQGSALFQFNSFGQPVNLEVPQRGGGTQLVPIEKGPFFQVLVAGIDGQENARLSLFPRAAENDFRFFGVDFAGNFALVTRDDDLHLDFDFSASLTVLNFDDAAVGSVSGDLDIVDGAVRGSFNGRVSIGGVAEVALGAELDEFGCVRLTEPILGLQEFGCQPVILVNDQLVHEEGFIFTDPFGNSFPETIRVRTSTTVGHDVEVRLRVEDETAINGQHYVASSIITTTIPADRASRALPITIVDDETVQFEDRRFRIEVLSAQYVDAAGLPIDPLFAPELSVYDRPATVTIRDNERPPLGPPVRVVIQPTARITQTPTGPGEPIRGSIDENNGPLQFEIAAPALQAGDSVQVVAQVLPVSSPVPTTDAADFGLTSRLGILTTLSGSAPSLLTIPVTQDTIAELNERFIVVFQIAREARFAPSTSLSSTLAEITLINDDPERPTDAVAFYNFDQPRIVVGEPFGFEFTASPSFTESRVTATPWLHSTQEDLVSSGLPKLEPPFAASETATPGAGASTWRPGSASVGRNLVVNPGAEDPSDPLRGWLPTAGQWSERPANGPAPESGSQYFRGVTRSLATLTQVVSLADDLAAIESGQQAYRIGGLIRTNGNVPGGGQIAVEFLDGAGRIVASTSTERVEGSLNWSLVASEIVVPSTTRSARITLQAVKSPLDSNTLDVYFDQIRLSGPTPQFFEFQVGFSGAEADPPQALDLTGIDFWQLGSSDGPQVWELRSSLDEFQTVLASGEVSAASLFEHTRQEFPTDALACLTADDTPITFRLYGSGGDALWTVDNVALLGDVHPQFECPAPPVAFDDGPFILRNDQEGRFDVRSNDTDINVNPQTTERLSVDSVVLVRGRGTVSHNGILGQVRYVPDSDFVGRAEILYTITDGNGGFDTATVTVDVIAPPTGRDDAYAAVTGTPLTISADVGVLANDDASGSVLTVDPTPVVAPRFGALTLNADGSFQYVPNSGFLGTDEFVYSALASVDGQPIALLQPRVRLTVLESATRRANADTFNDVVEDQTFTVAAPGVLANDLRGFAADGITPAAPLQAVLVNGPRLVFGGKTQENFGSLTLKEDGSFTYSPPANFHSENIKDPLNPKLVTFSYRVGSQVTDPVATVSLNVRAVNDRPQATGTSVSIATGSTASRTFTVPRASDVESPSANLSYLLVSQPKIGKVVSDVFLSGEFTYTPPSTGFSQSTSFQYIVRDRGSDAGLSTSAADSLPVTVNLVAQTLITTTTISKIGFVSKGYIDGATVFFDANHNAVADTVTIPTADDATPLTIAEPVTTTRADGTFELEIPLEFDRNGDGVFQLSEGRIVVLGGTDTSLGLPLATSLISAGDATAVTPLTTLTVLVAEEGNLTLDAAQQVSRKAFNLQPVDLLNYDAIQKTLDGQLAAPTVYRAAVVLQNSAAMIASSLGLSNDRIAQAERVAYEAMARTLLDVDAQPDWTDVSVIRDIVYRAVLQSGSTVLPEQAQEVATVIAEINGRLQAVAAVPDEDFLEQVLRIKRVAQEQVVVEIAEFVTNEISTEQFLTQNTGEELTQRITSAQPGQPQPPRVTVNDVTRQVDPGNETEFEFVVMLDRIHDQSVVVDFATQEDTAIEGVDFTGTFGSLDFAPGETAKSVLVPVRATTDAAIKSFQLVLTNATNAGLLDPIGVGSILTGDDGDGVDATVEQSAPNNGDGNADGVPDFVQSDVASLLNAGGTSYLTIQTANANPLFKVRASLPAVDETSNLPADAQRDLGQLEFQVATSDETSEIEILFEVSQPITSWYHFGPTINEPVPHWYEFEFDGSTGAILFDDDQDGFVDRVRLHLTDGGRGDSDGLADGTVTVKAIATYSAEEPPTNRDPLEFTGTPGNDRIELVWFEAAQEIGVYLNEQDLGRFSTVGVPYVQIDALAGNDRVIVDPLFPLPTHLYGRGGNDFLYAGGGPDAVYGGPGNDRLFGGDNNDVLMGGPGNDLLLGEGGDDFVIGGEGNDVLQGDRHPQFKGIAHGNDYLNGGPGNDQLFGGEADDLLLGGPGNDVLLGEADDDVLIGGPGKDVLRGDRDIHPRGPQAGRDLLIGGFDADVLAGGPDDDIMVGGYTLFDAEIDALSKLSAEWSSDRSFLQRRKNLEQASGPILDGTPYQLVDGETVLDDRVKDVLVGGAGCDWAIASTAIKPSFKRRKNQIDVFHPESCDTRQESTRVLAAVFESGAEDTAGQLSNPWDVNGDGQLSPLDALLIINVLNSSQVDFDAIRKNGDGEPPTRYDVNGDGRVSPIDALLVINRLNEETPVAWEPYDSIPETTADELVDYRDVASDDLLDILAADVAEEWWE